MAETARRCDAGLATAILFGRGMVLAKKKPLRLPPTISVAWQGLLGMVLVVSLAGFEHPDWDWVTTGDWVSVAYISTIPPKVAYLTWFRASRIVPASTAVTTVQVSSLCKWHQGTGRRTAGLPHLLPY